MSGDVWRVSPYCTHNNGVMGGEGVGVATGDANTGDMRAATAWCHALDMQICRYPRDNGYSFSGVGTGSAKLVMPATRMRDGHPGVQRVLACCHANPQLIEVLYLDSRFLTGA